MKEIRKPKVGAKIIVDLISGGGVVGIYKGYGEVFDEKFIELEGDGIYFVAPVTVPVRDIKLIHYPSEKVFGYFLFANKKQREEWEKAAEAACYDGNIIMPDSIQLDPKLKMPSRH